jgi:ligand-binding sensor domain-containing protein
MLTQNPPWWKSTLQFVLGIVLIAVIGIIAYLVWPRPELPAGWQIIRPSQDVMALVVYEDNIWAGGRDGLVVIDRKSGEVIREVELEGPLDLVSSIALDPSGDGLWVGHLDGLSFLVGKTWRTYTVDDGLVNNEIHSLRFDLEGILWIGTESGVMQFDGRSFTSTPQGISVLRGPVSVIYLDGEGRLWFGNGLSSSGGLAMFDGDSWVEFSTEDGLVHPMVNTLLQDDKNALWIGTGFSNLGGVTILSEGEIMVLTQEDGLAGAKVRSLFQDDAGTIWVGSEYNGITYRTGKSWTILTPEDGLSGWEVKDMLQDSELNLWLGTENGLTRIDRQAWERLVGIQ